MGRKPKIQTIGEAYWDGWKDGLITAKKIVRVSLRLLRIKNKVIDNLNKEIAKYYEE